MSIRQTLSDDLCHKLRLVGLPKDVVLPLVNHLTKSVNAEGPENVVKRLKVLKQAAVNHLAGQHIDLPWIAHDCHGPKGPWRPVWRMLLSKQHKKQKRALNAMMVYASFVLPKSTGPTPTQERKFELSAHQPPDRVGQCVTGLKKVLNPSWDEAFRRLLAVANTPATPGQPPDATQYITQLQGTSKEDIGRVDNQINRFLTQYQFYPFHAFPEVVATLGEVGTTWARLTHPGNGFWKDWKNVEIDDVDGNIGVIGFSQEPGFKFRAFASPNKVLQSALEPFKRSLLQYLQRCPWDNTHDQQHGVIEVQKWLQAGKSVFSVDLSDATNNFPLDLQLTILRDFDVFEESTLKLFEFVCRSPYRRMWGQKLDLIWNVGQPLGAGPSFPAFAITHAVLALQAEVLAGIPRSEAGSTFQILGDDFVTNHAGVHSHYRDLLQLMLVPISESKCLISDLSAEFAGKLIMSDYVFHGFKYKEISDHSFLDVVRSLGVQSISTEFLSRKQYEFCKLVESFPEPLGLGFNPQGIPLAERYELFLTISEELQRYKGSTATSTEAELNNAFAYQTELRWTYYFNIDRRYMPQPIRVYGSNTISPDAVMTWIHGAPSVPLAVKTGDPRPCVLEGLSSRRIKLLRHTADSARERYLARIHQSKHLSEDGEIIHPTMTQ